MPLYQYKATLPNGDISEGRMEAASQQVVIKHLQSLGQIIIRAEEVTAAAPSAGKKQYSSSKIKLAHNELTALTVELATLLDAGLPLDRSLKTLSAVAKSEAEKYVIDELHQQVRGGRYLSEALGGLPEIFSHFYINMVKAGETGGALAQTLEQLALTLEHEQEVRNALVSKLIYPLVLIAAAGASIIFMLGYVVPKFSELFLEAGATLPTITQIVIFAGNLVANYGWLLVIILIIAVWVFRKQYSTKDGRLLWDTRWLNLPLVGELLIKLDTSRFSYTLGQLLKSGVPLLQAAKISEEVITNKALANNIKRLLPALQAGQGLSTPLAESKYFPELAVQLVRVGEESGDLDSMLGKVAGIYEREVETTMTRIISLLEPVLILGLGIVIAAIIISILLAILNINNIIV